MSTLVSPLVSGIAGAESGTAWFFAYGTDFQTPAIAYDVDGEALGVSVTLDSYGGAECYVSGRVQVWVEDSSGILVRSFAVQADDASSTVMSASLTGTDPDSGSQVEGGVLTQRSAWDKMAVSFGAPDFLVRPTGTTVDRYLKDVLAASATSANPFYSVTDYGAVGDGVSNASPGIAAAIAAASVTGGIVFFPEGNYLAITGIAVNSDKVSILGVSALGSVITNATAGNVALTINAGSSTTGRSVVMNIGFDHSSTGTNWAIQAVTTPGIVIENVRVRGHQKGINLKTRGVLRNCDVLTVAGAAQPAALLDSSSAGSEINGGRYETATEGSSTIDLDTIENLVTGVYIVIVQSTPDSYCVDVSAARNKVIGCKFDRNTTGTTGGYAIRITADVEFWEDANTFLQAVAVGSFTGWFLQSAATYKSIYRGSRRGTTDAPAAGASFTPSADIERHFYSITGGATVFTPTGQKTDGARMTIIMYNSTGGAIVTATSLFFGNGSWASLAAGKTRVYDLIYYGTTDVWHQIGTTIDTP